MQLNVYLQMTFSINNISLIRYTYTMNMEQIIFVGKFYDVSVQKYFYRNFAGINYINQLRPSQY